MEKEQISTKDTSAQSPSQQPVTITVVADVENTATCLNVLEPKHQHGNPSSRPIMLAPMKDANKTVSKISLSKSQNPNAAWTSNEINSSAIEQIPTSSILCSKFMNTKKAWTSPDKIEEMEEFPPDTSSSSKQAAASNISNSRSEKVVNPRVPDDIIEELDTPPTDGSSSRLHAPLQQSCHSRVLEMWFTHVIDKLDLETDMCLKVVTLTAIGIILLITPILLYLFGHDSVVGYIFAVIFLVAFIVYFIIVGAIAVTVFVYKYGLRALRDHKRS